MDRRFFLLTMAVPGLASAQSQTFPPASPVDSVALYVLPTDGVPEQIAANIARSLTRETGLWVKSSVWVPAGGIEPMPGTNQYAGEDYLPLGVRTSKQLPDTTARTYFIVLTDRDINARSQNFRFQYSMHNPMARTSVLSVARLFHEKDGSRSALDVVNTRTKKMLMRIVGEMRLGWTRTNDPLDLMYAPIMSIEDIDRMNLIKSVERRKQ